MTDEKLVPSVLYTTEAEESKKRTEEELMVPDPVDADEAVAKLLDKEKDKGDV